LNQSLKALHEVLDNPSLRTIPGEFQNRLEALRKILDEKSTRELRDEIQNTLAAVRFQLQGVVVVVFPHESFVRSQVKYRLVGDVNRFEADHLGQIVLEVQWGIANAGGAGAA